MKISEFIEELKKSIEEYGDIEIRTHEFDHKTEEYVPSLPGVYEEKDVYDPPTSKFCNVLYIA